VLVKDHGNSIPQMVKDIGGTCWEPEDVELRRETLDEVHRLGPRDLPLSRTPGPRILSLGAFASPTAPPFPDPTSRWVRSLSALHGLPRNTTLWLENDPGIVEHK
jgi:hypothetical protein